MAIDIALDMATVSKVVTVSIKTPRLLFLVKILAVNSLAKQFAIYLNVVVLRL